MSYRAIEVDGKHRLLNETTDVVAGQVFHTRREALLEKWAIEEARDELAMEAGMLHGVNAYNEAMGWDVSFPEPCGHHCQSDCPRCGR